jgi:hypothetical protein
MMPPMAENTGSDAPNEETPPCPPDSNGGPRPVGAEAGATGPVIVLAFLCVLATLCFFPLLRYFFSQDDFYLIYRSTHEAGDMLASAFGPSPHHFRPLTKTVYFAVAYRVFGLHALPFHIVSLAVHLGNSLLIYVLLRDFRLSAAPAAVATALFALSVSFFHAIGWISCIQQLGGALFFLLTFVLAITALRDRSWKWQMMSVVAYILALLSLEQTFLVPLLIVMAAVLGLTEKRYSVAETLRTMWPHTLILCAYAAVRLFWKGMPSEGISRFAYGDNVVLNLAAYLSAMYTYWPDISNQIPYRTLTMTPSHFVLLALVVYNVARLRVRQVAFALIFIVATLLPTLFLVYHFFYYHTYVPAFGAVFLIGLLTEDVFKVIGRGWLAAQSRQLLAAAVVIAVITAISSWKVRVIERRAIDQRTRQLGSFVLRRAIIAEAAYHDLTKKAGDMTGVRHIDLVYGWPGHKKAGGRPRDLFWAFSDGYAVRVFFDDYDVEDVQMLYAWNPQGDYREEPDRRVFFYDPAGHCYTYDEMKPGSPPQKP